MIGNGSCVQSELTSVHWSAPSSAGLGIRANTCLWIPLQLDLIFGCLNLFKSFQLQSIAENLAKEYDPSRAGNRTRELLGLRCCALRKHSWPESKRKEFFCYNLLGSSFITFGLSGSLGLGFNKVRHLQIDLERLHSACSHRTSRLEHRSIVFTVHWGWPD